MTDLLRLHDAVEPYPAEPSDEQRKQLTDLPTGGGFPGGQPGKILSPFVQTRLTLSDDQKEMIFGDNAATLFKIG